jgi:type II secretory pathway component PulF
MLDEDLQDGTPPRKSAVSRSTRFRLIVHGIAWGVLLALLAFGVPRVETVFADFGVPLPDVTILVIQASHRIVASVLLTLLLLVADGLVLDAFRRRGDFQRARSWSLLMIATPLSMVAVMLWALLLPMLTCMPRLSG